MWMETENSINKLDDSLSRKPFEWEGLFFLYVMEKSKNIVQEALFAQRNIVTRFLAKIMSLLKCRYYKIKNTGCCGVFITH